MASLLPARGGAEGSWLGARDDRARLLAVGLLTAAMSASGSPRATVWCAAVGLGACLSVGLDARALAARLWPLAALVAPLIVLTPFHRPEGPYRLLVAGWSWGPTDVGLERTGALTARVVGIGLALAAGLAAAPFERTVRALQSLRLPRALTQTLLLTARYLFLFRRDLGEVRHALAARGFRARPNLATARTFAGVTGGLLVRSVVRTEQVEQAMRCRGYAGRLVLPSDARWGARDTALVVGAALMAAFLIALERGGLP